ncbi:MAG: hypothetical protein LVQ95_02275 [Candidatus Micrarchaeales archaeon]|nr:hypothetical protein [Candidatus Micrarchaeales archaeon]
MARARAKKRARAGSQRMKERDIHDTLLLAFIFLGLGIGLAYGQPGPGLLVGAGIGVLARGYSKYGKDKVMVATSLSVASYVIFLIGIYFIFLGISLLEGIVWFYPYAASIPLVIIGLILLIVFFKRR